MKLKGIYKFFSFLAECKGSIIDAGSGLPFLLLMHGKYFGSSAVQRCRGHSNMQEGNSSIKKKITVFCPEM